MPTLILILVLILLHTGSNCYAEDITSSPTQDKSTFFKGIPLVWPPPTLSGLPPEVCKSPLNLSQEEQSFWDKNGELIAQKLYPLWAALPKGPVNDIVIGYKFTRSGKLTKSIVLTSTGAPELDERYLAAFRQSFPHPPIPEKIFFDENLTYILSPSRVKFYIDQDTDAKRHQFGLENNAKLKDWIENANTIVRKNWNPGGVNGLKGSKQIKLLSAVELKTGRILSTRIIQSSCDPTLDQTGIKAVEKSNPLPPFNTDFPLDVVGIQWVFNYELWANNMNK